MFALGVHQVVGNRHRAAHQQFLAAAAGAFLFDLAQHLQGKAVIRTDEAGSVAMRARRGGGLDHAGAQTLARHFHQAEAGNAAHLDAGPVGLELVFQLLLDGGVVLALVHVDEVDHDQPGKVAQPELARHLFGGFQIGLERGLLDRAFLGRAARVDVDGDKRLGDADHDVAAGLELHRRVEHRAEVAFHLIAGKKRQLVAVLLHVLGVGRHDHLHEVLGDAVAALALDQNLVDVAAVEIADRTFDQVAFFIDLGRRDRFQRQLANLLPQALQVFVVALDLGFGAFGAGGADDQPRALRHVDLVGNLFELLAVGGIGDLAADATATRGVGHEHTIAAREREIGGQRRALVAALFLDDLHQQDLAHLDDFLDLVAARARFARRTDVFLIVVIGHRFDIAVLVGGIGLGRGLVFVVLGLDLGGIAGLGGVVRSRFGRGHVSRLRRLFRLVCRRVRLGVGRVDGLFRLSSVRRRCRFRRLGFGRIAALGFLDRGLGDGRHRRQPFERVLAITEVDGFHPLDFAAFDRIGIGGLLRL